MHLSHLLLLLGIVVFSLGVVLCLVLQFRLQRGQLLLAILKIYRYGMA